MSISDMTCTALRRLVAAEKRCGSGVSTTFTQLMVATYRKGMTIYFLFFHIHFNVYIYFTFVLLVSLFACFSLWSYNIFFLVGLVLFTCNPYGQFWFFKCFLAGAPPIFSPLLILCSGLVPARYIGSVWQALMWLCFWYLNTISSFV